MTLVERQLHPFEVTMKHNVGTFDRAFRIVVGLAILSLLVVGPKTLWALVGLIPLGTGIFGFCPLYRACGFTSCSLGGHGKPNKAV
jgi:hypothetical protein